MKLIYFFLAVTGLVFSCYLISTTLPIDDFNDIIILTLQLLLSIMCVIGIIMQRDCFSTLRRSMKMYKTRRRA